MIFKLACESSLFKNKQIHKKDEINISTVIKPVTTLGYSPAKYCIMGACSSSLKL